MENGPRRIYINRRSPWAVWTLLALNIAMFLLEIFLSNPGDVYGMLSGGVNANILYLLGAKENLSIVSGEYWRLITPVFLHASWEHLIFNSIALFLWGPHVEALFGRAKFVLAYLISGVFGNAMSYCFSVNLSVGASGAIFGIFGMLVYFRKESPELFKRFFGVSVLAVIGINLVNGFISPGIDNFGHLGGLIGGYLSARALGLYHKNKITKAKAVALVILLALLAAMCLWGYYRYSPYLEYLSG